LDTCYAIVYKIKSQSTLLINFQIGLIQAQLKALVENGLEKLTLECTFTSWCKACRVWLATWHL